ncbi:MAG: transposase zinc-binding domain-containing protein [Myxococcales bacterium]
MRPRGTRQGPTPVASKRYQRHEPEATPLYKIVAEHLETFLAEAREKHERALPQYVERELREYLKCGILAHGFLRARCRSCGKDLLVALSCKKRGVCPSCNARRMCGTAAHLTDAVIPEVPLRQWVLSVPFELRLLLARDPRALTAVGRIFVQEIFRSQRERAGLSALRPMASGAVCFPQRFGGSMNLNVHFHVAVPDGVFTATKGATRAEFWRLPTPDRLDLETLTVNVEMRVVSWLRRHGFLNDDSSDRAVEPSARSALEACLEGSLGLGDLSTLPGGRGPHQRRSRCAACANQITAARRTLSRFRRARGRRHLSQRSRRPRTAPSLLRQASAQP